MLLAWLVAFTLSGCASLLPARDLVSQAIRARGGPLQSFTRDSALRVHFGLPGLWSWRIAYRLPESLRVSILTDGDDQHYLSDGAELRSWLGGMLVSREPVSGSGFESWVRWTAVVSLDVLADAQRVHWSELDPEALEAPAVRGLRASWHADPDAVYRLGFDGTGRLVRAQGPVEIPGIGEGILTATFSDYRSKGRWVLPFTIDYELAGRPLLEERVLEILPDDPSLEPDSFRAAP